MANTMEVSFDPGQAVRHAARNITKFCFVGRPEGCHPDATPLAATGINAGPGAAFERPGSIIPYILSHSGDFTVSIFGPEKEARAEFEALKNAGAKLVGDERVVNGNFFAIFKGVHLVLKDITEELRVSTNGLLGDPEHLIKLSGLQSKVDKLEAENAALKEENARLKLEASKVLPHHKGK